jgi:hypothetical protein
MSNKSESDLIRVHIWLHQDDVDWIKAIWKGDLKLSAAVRAIIGSYRRQVDAKVAAGARAPKTSSTDLDEVLEESKP